MAKMMTQKAAPGLGIDADLARKLLRDMVLIRRFEEKAAEAYALGKIGGVPHPSIGGGARGAGRAPGPPRGAVRAFTVRRHRRCRLQAAAPPRRRESGVR